MDDLVTWLRAQLDEDERVAQEAAANNWIYSGETYPASMHIARHKPTQVLREVDAKRQIIADCNDYIFGGNEAATDGLCVRVLTLLALAYADRPGYRAEEWRYSP